ncbi:MULTISPECIES: EamA/RhaT family transporter [unclassified Streptomyces]|uniref:EamA/RhaT family transporter n=1 Tax=unclassified Streptomyces TaxID=2593676 RepID=UPI00136B0229|nr:EamA/RhaT family transporter [Streptomyces sp. SHP 1-2]MCW5254347.1 EamA/RhaT family transporter [Streptomyces sp. SHP 1-2]MYU24453.1 EamA/RhaT family transporter [Streptomyces sp. SID8352]
MSAENGTNGTPDGTAGSPPAAGPRPEPLRFYGTTWVGHDGGYAARRAGLALGSAVAAVAACLVLRFAYQGLRIAEVGGFVTGLTIVMFAVCSALAFGHTWGGYSQRPDPERRSSLRGLLAVGFVGSLCAYALRSLFEAPGEKLLRAEYETAREQYERRTARRSGNPRKKKRPA